MPSPPLPMAARPSASDRGTYVGHGRGDYVQETSFRYTGAGADPVANQASEERRCRPASCFNSVRQRCAGLNSRQHREAIMSNAGPGGGEYVMETAFKFVGHGEGDFTLVDGEEEAASAGDSSTSGEAPGRWFGFLSSLVDSCSSQDGFRWCGLHVLGVVAICFVLALAVRGCGGSPSTPPGGPGQKKDEPSKPQDCLNQMLSMAERGETLAWPHYKHIAVMNHSQWERYGFLLRSTGNGEALRVDGVSGGLTAKWNTANRNNQEAEVGDGDYLIAVNGVKSSTSLMLKELSRPKVMTLELVRVRCGYTTTSTVTTTTVFSTTVTETWTGTSSSSTATTTTALLKGSWECYELTVLEKNMLKTWPDTDVGAVCTRERHDDYRYQYTKGDQTSAPGCGHCSCCRMSEGETTTTPLLTTTTATLPTAPLETLTPGVVVADIFYPPLDDEGAMLDFVGPSATGMLEKLQPVELLTREFHWPAGSQQWSHVETQGPFAVRWRGSLQVRGEGNYDFEVQSDKIVELVIDGKVVLKSGQWSTAGGLALSRHQGQAFLTQGLHAMSLSLAQTTSQGVLGMLCRYSGPDTASSLVPIPASALQPPKAAVPAASGTSKMHLQRKFDGDVAGTAAQMAAGTSGVGAALLAVVTLAAIAPALQLAAAPWREALQRARERRTSHRDLRRYDTLAEVMEHTGGRERNEPDSAAN